MAIVDTLLYIFEADADKLDRSVKQADKSVEALGNEARKSDLALGALGEGFIGLIQGAGAALLAGLSVTALASMVSATVDHVDALNDQAEALGIAVGALDAWNAAATKTGGTTGAFATSLATFNERAQEAARKGSKELLEMFDKAGLSAQFLKENLDDPIALLSEMSDTLAGLSAAEAAGLGKKLGLDPGTINLLREGKANLQDLVAAQQALGGVTAEQAEAAGRYNDVIDEARRVWDDVRRQFVLFVIPALTWVGEKWVQVGKLVRENSTAVAFGIGVIALAVTGLLVPALATAAASAWALIAPFLPIIAIVAAVGAAIALVAEDIYQFQMGNDSLVGEMAKKWPIIRTLIEGIGAALVFVIAYFAELASAIGAFFTGGPEAAFDQLFNAIQRIGKELRDQYPEFGVLLTLVESALTVMSFNLTLFGTVAKNTFGGLVDLASTAFSAITTIVGVWWDVVSGIFRSFVALINDGPAAAFAILQESVGSALGRINAAVTQAGEVLQNVTGRMREAIQWVIDAWGKLLARVGDGGVLGGLLKGGARVLGLADAGARQLAGASPAGSAAAAVAPGSVAGRSSVRNTDINVGQVTVNTQATDAKGVAAAVGSTLQDQMRSASDSFDDGVAA